MDSIWTAGCVLCKDIVSFNMSNGQVSEQVPHYHVFEPLPSPVIRPVSQDPPVPSVRTSKPKVTMNHNDIEEFKTANRLAQIRKHHRQITRMQDDLAAMASAAQLPKRAREVLEEELFGNEVCSSSSSDEDSVI